MGKASRSLWIPACLKINASERTKKDKRSHILLSSLVDWYENIVPKSRIKPFPLIPK
jgi:hypothetical protein